MASANEDLSTFVQKLCDAGIVDTLAGTGSFTVFAPTNEAFDKLDKADKEYLLKNKDHLIQVLKYHIVDGVKGTSDVHDGEQIDTWDGMKVSMTKQGTTVKINGATVTQADIAASNGVMHVIDSVLVPPEMKKPTIPVVVKGDPKLSRFAQALTDAGLDTVLGAAGPFTLFAPTDRAVQGMAKGTLTTEVLKYHVILGDVHLDGLNDGTHDFATLQGQIISITIDGMSTKVNTASVTEHLPASNGAVHVIDAVLSPSGFALPMAEEVERIRV